MYFRCTATIWFCGTLWMGSEGRVKNARSFIFRIDGWCKSLCVFNTGCAIKIVCCSFLPPLTLALALGYFIHAIESDSVRAARAGESHICSTFNYIPRMCNSITIMLESFSVTSRRRDLVFVCAPPIEPIVIIRCHSVVSTLQNTRCGWIVAFKVCNFLTIKLS